MCLPGREGDKVDRREIAPIQLPNGDIVHAEITVLSSEEQVAFSHLKLDQIRSVLEGVATVVSSSVDKLRPSRTTVEVSLELAVEGGKLTALIAQGSAKASLKVTLEWSGRPTVAENALMSV